MPRTTPDPADIERLYKRALNDSQISEQLDCDPADVRTWRGERGLLSNRVRMTQECEADIEAGIRRKMTVAEIVEWADVSRSQIRRVAKRIGVEPRRARNAKEPVLRMLAEGKPTSEIVAKVKCTRQVVAHYRTMLRKIQKNQGSGGPEAQPSASETQENVHVCP